MPIEKRTFEKGMNQDLAESLMSPGMYRYALNIRNGNSERGAVGVITNAEGNQEFSVTLPQEVTGLLVHTMMKHMTE